MTVDRQSDWTICYDRDEGTYHVKYDWSAPGPLHLDVLEMYAAITGESIETLPLLSEAIDPDALTGLFTPGSRETPDPTLSVTFAYGEFEITIHGDGGIVLDPLNVRGGDRSSRVASRL